MTFFSVSTLSILSSLCGATAFLSFVPPQHKLALPTCNLRRSGSESFRRSRVPFSTTRLYHSGGYGDDDEDEDAYDEFNLNEVDWRSFRAKLVMTYDSSPVSTTEEKTTTAYLNPYTTGFPGPITQPSHDVMSSSTNSIFGHANDPGTSAEEVYNAELITEDVDGIGSLFFSFDEAAAQEHFNILQNGWAYDSGNVIETGAVILGGVEQDFGFGLRQQYFHKAAILVLDHDENKFTKGIILNRPSDRVLRDPDNPHIKWRVWFGGDVQGLDSIMPDIICLHSLKSPRATSVSTQIMKDIKVRNQMHQLILL